MNHRQLVELIDIIDGGYGPAETLAYLIGFPNPRRIFRTLYFNVEPHTVEEIAQFSNCPYSSTNTILREFVKNGWAVIDLGEHRRKDGRYPAVYTLRRDDPT